MMNTGIVNVKKRNIISLAFMIVLTCLTQIFVIMKSSLVAGLFGASIEMDAYNFANSIPSFLFGILAGGIPTIVIPSYIKKESRKNIDSFITMVYGSILFLSIFLAIFRFPILGFFSNKNSIFLNISCNVLLFLLLSNFLSSIVGITDAYFQCTNKYNVPKIINLIVQMITVFFIIFSKDISIYQYTAIISIGLIISFMLNLCIALKYGWRYKPCMNLKNEQVRKLLISFLPILFSNGIYKFTLFVDSLIASRLNEGLLTILSYSNQMAVMIDTVIIGNLLTYAYPKIVRQIQNNDNQEIFWNQTVLFHGIVLIIITGFATVGLEGINLLFQHGKFSSESATLVFLGTFIYVIGQQSSVLVNLIYRYFYSIGDTHTPAKNSMIASIINLIVSIIFVNLIGFFGIILGTVFASLVSMIMIMKQYKKNVSSSIRFKKYIRIYMKNIAISIITIFIVCCSKLALNLSGSIVPIIIFGLETLIVYFILVLLFNKELLKQFKEI